MKQCFTGSPIKDIKKITLSYLKKIYPYFFIYYDVTSYSEYHQDYTNSNNQTKNRHAHTQARRTFASLPTNYSKPHPIRYQERLKTYMKRKGQRENGRRAAGYQSRDGAWKRAGGAS